MCCLRSRKIPRISVCSTQHLQVCEPGKYTDENERVGCKSCPTGFFNLACAAGSSAAGPSGWLQGLAAGAHPVSMQMRKDHLPAKRVLLACLGVETRRPLDIAGNAPMGRAMW